MDEAPLRDREPLSPAEAKELIGRILAAGTAGRIVITDHAKEEMKKDNLTTVDLQGALRGGWVEEGEEINRTWRYRVCTSRAVFLVAFGSETELRIVTAWSKAAR